MSRILMAVAIDDWGAGPLAAKEAATMALEPLGNVQVLKVKVEGDEQLALTGSGLCNDDVSNLDTGKER